MEDEREMVQHWAVCTVCGEEFDMRLLDMVILHMHEGSLPEPSFIVGERVERETKG